MIALRDPEVRDDLARSLRSDRIEIRAVDRVDDIVSGISRDAVDVLVFDLGLSDSPAAVIEAVHAAAPAVRVVACGEASEAAEAAVAEKGVFFYAVGFGSSQLVDAIRAGLRRKGP